MSLPCNLIDLRRFDFRGAYSTDKKLNQTIDKLVENTLVAAAAEDLTDRIICEALLKTKGDSHIRRFRMTSTKTQDISSDEEGTTDTETDSVPQGDTEAVGVVVDEDQTKTEKESLEEEIKQIISKISAFEFESYPAKAVTEGRGDAGVVEEAVPAEVCESEALPLEKPSSEELVREDHRDEIAAWEEAVEVEVQVIDPTYDDEDGDTAVSPYPSSTESLSDTTAEDEETEPHVDRFSDELELETLAFCTSIVVDIMSRVEESIVGIETNIQLQLEADVENTIHVAQIQETNPDETNEKTLTSQQDITELEIITPKPSASEPICGQTSEEDLYDIESINVHSEDILKLNAQDITVSDSQNNPQTTFSAHYQNGGMDHGLETIIYADSLPVNNQYMKTEHLESCAATNSINHKMEKKVQMCDDIPVKAAKQSESTTALPDNTSVSSLDLASEVNYRNADSEETKPQSDSSSLNICTEASPILTHKDSEDNTLILYSEIKEDNLSLSSATSAEPLLSESDDHSETQNCTEAPEVLENKDIQTEDASTLEAKESMDLLSSITSAIKSDFIISEIEKTKELIHARQQSSKTPLQTTSQGIQEDKQSFEESEDFFQTFGPSTNYHSAPSSPPDSSHKPHYTSEYNTKVINPTYGDQSTVYRRENVSPYASSTESLSDTTAEYEDAETHVDSFSDELEIEALAFCTGIVVDILSRVEASIAEVEADVELELEEEVENTIHVYQIQENNDPDETNEETSASQQVLTELDTTIPKPSTPELICGQTEEDLYDIESINVHSEDILKINTQVIAVSDSQSNYQTTISAHCKNGGMDHGLETIIYADSLPVNNQYMKTEHLESCAAPKGINHKMEKKAQSCNDFPVKAAKQSERTTALLHNTSVGSLDLPSEVNYKNADSEETKRQSESSSLNICTEVSPILTHKDSEDNTLVLYSEIKEDKLSISSASSAEPLLSESDDHNETENCTEAPEVLENKGIQTDDSNTLEAKESMDLLSSITSAIKSDFIISEIEKTKELIHARPQRSKTALQTTFQGIQEDKQKFDESEDYFEALRPSTKYHAARCSLPDTSDKPHCTSEHKTKVISPLQSSSGDESGASTNNDIEDKVQKNASTTRKLFKRWKFGNKVRNFFSSIKRKL